MVAYPDGGDGIFVDSDGTLTGLKSGKPLHQAYYTVADPESLDRLDYLFWANDCTGP